jgi:hypothetical protein
MEIGEIGSAGVFITSNLLPDYVERVYPNLFGIFIFN